MNNCQYCNYDISTYLGGLSEECANCWEVRRRLEDFLTGCKENRDYVRCLLERYEDEL